MSEIARPKYKSYTDSLLRFGKKIASGIEEMKYYGIAIAALATLIAYEATARASEPMWSIIIQAEHFAGRNNNGDTENWEKSADGTYITIPSAASASGWSDGCEVVYDLNVPDGDAYLWMYALAQQDHHSLVDFGLNDEFVDTFNVGENNRGNWTWVRYADPIQTNGVSSFHMRRIGSEDCIDQIIMTNNASYNPNGSNPTPTEEADTPTPYPTATATSIATPTATKVPGIVKKGQKLFMRTRDFGSGIEAFDIICASESLFSLKTTTANALPLGAKTEGGISTERDYLLSDTIIVDVTDAAGNYSTFSWTFADLNRGDEALAGELGLRMMSNAEYQAWKAVMEAEHRPTATETPAPTNTPIPTEIPSQGNSPTAYVVYIHSPDIDGNGLVDPNDVFILQKYWSPVGELSEVDGRIIMYRWDGNKLEKVDAKSSRVDDLEQEVIDAILQKQKLVEQIK